jgi:hypothetical protein
MNWLNDKYIFVAFEAALVLLLFWAIVRDTGLLRRDRSITRELKRGQESWNKLYLAFGFSSVLTLQVINSSEAWKNYKVIISLFDISILCYLFFYNGWFRNKIIGFITKSTEMKERL